MSRLILAFALAASIYAASLTLLPHPANIIAAPILAGISAAAASRRSPWLPAAAGGLTAYMLLLASSAPLLKAFLLLLEVLGVLAAMAPLYHLIAPAIAANLVSAAIARFYGARASKG